MDNVSPEKIIHEVPEHSCYLMQTIKIGSSEALVFFDRGANIHIIDGLLAEKEGLQKVSSNPTNLTVVGGSKVRSNHGTFRFNLGPGERGEYHEVVCVGMDDVTGGFGTYDLKEICQEYLEQAKDEEKDLTLPEKVGGSKVHLLLGIKNTNLDPVLVKVLWDAMPDLEEESSTSNQVLHPNKWKKKSEFGWRIDIDIDVELFENYHVQLMI